MKIQEDSMDVSWWQFNYDALLTKNTTFSTAVHHVSGITKNDRTIFETSDTPLLDTLCDRCKN